MLLLVDVLFIFCLMSQDTWSRIHMFEPVQKCRDIVCHNNATLVLNSCRCVCTNAFTGHFCETELKTSVFPRGNYALPASLIGCPEENDESYGWMTGYINLTMTDYIDTNMTDFSDSTLKDTDLRHYWSNEIHLLGPYHRRTVQLNFCSRMDKQSFIQNDSTGPLWPSGNYCIFKVGEVCPKDGFIHLKDYKVIQGEHDGALPEVKFTSDAGVTLYFCCQNGETSEREVSFGDSSLFLLLKGWHTDCLNITDMDSQEETFAFRKNEYSSWPTFGGVPHHSEDENFFNITFCFYKPTVHESCMYMEDKGASYRGSFSTNKFDKQCDNWTSVIDEIDPRYVADLEKNYCRKLSKPSKFPMCFTNGFERSCEGIPICDDTITKMENVAYLKRVDSSPGFVSIPSERPLTSVELNQNQQLVVDGSYSSAVNFRISVPVIEPYFKVDLGFSHEIYGAIVHRALLLRDAGSFWQRMVLWIGRDEWSFLTFGSYMCGGMVNAYKNDMHLFVCERPLIGRYVTLQVNVHSDPDIVSGEYLNLQLNEIIVYGKATRCGRYLGLMSGAVLASQITTSSYIDGFHGNQSRLNEIGPGWCPNVEDEKPFIQVHLLLPMVVEGVIIQSWLDDGGFLMYTRSFKVLYGLQYDNMKYYTDRFGPKVFHTFETKAFKLTQTFWFSKPFVAKVLGLEMSGEEHQCLKIEWIVCRRRVERDCGREPSIGWESLTERELAIKKFRGKASRPDYSTCMHKCRTTSFCSGFEYNNETKMCRLSEIRLQPPFVTYSSVENRMVSFTYKLCYKEITNAHQTFSSETIIMSPHYPYYYGDHSKYTWDLHLADAVAVNIDILDVQLYDKNVNENGIVPKICYDKLTIDSTDKTEETVRIKEIASIRDQKHYRESRIITKGNHVFIRMESCFADHTMPFRGFALKITKSDCPVCLNVQVCTSTCGYIQSPFFPSGMFKKSTTLEENTVFHIRGNSYEYVKIHIIHYDVPDAETVFISFADIYAEGTELKTEFALNLRLYSIYYSQNNYLDLRSSYAVGAKSKGYKLRYTLMKISTWNQSMYEMNRSVCETDWMYFKGSCYILTRFPKGTYLDARRSCANIGAELAIITSILESNAINYYLLSHRNLTSLDVVFGLRALAKEKEYKWIDGSKAIFQNWYTDWSNENKSRPGLLMVNDCVVIRIQSSQNSSNWVIQSCRTDYTNALCEKKLNGKKASDETNHLEFEQMNKTLWKSTYKCRNGSLIDMVSRCDQVVDCVDGSDEYSCEFPTSGCEEKQFQCETDMQCIPVSRYCDYIIDCDDESDERECVRPDCSDDQFRCESGECVPNSDRCDIKLDCLDGSDEVDCEDVDCSHAGKFFKCSGESACIPLSKVCDGFVDCPGTFKSDEAHCEHVMVKSTCNDCIFTVGKFSHDRDSDVRKSIQLESHDNVPDRYSDGFHNSGTYNIDLGGKLENTNTISLPVECEFDETSGIISTVMHHKHEASVPRENKLLVYNIPYLWRLQRSLTANQNFVELLESIGMTCSQKLEVECYRVPDITDKVRILAYRGIESCRLYKPECVDRSGSPVCGDTRTNCKCDMSIADWQNVARDVWFKDTFDLNNPKYIPMKNVRLRGTEYPGQLRVAVGPLVCNSSMPRTSDKLKCNNGKVVPVETRCIYDADRYGSVTGCRDNTHLLNCGSFECPYGFAKCPNSFCIPLKYVCDGHMDCRFGEDELSCDTWTCPNQYKCRHSKTCIALTQVCDGWRDCPLGDDETLCDATCPFGCTCNAGETDCSEQKLKFRNLESVSKDTRILNLNHNTVIFNDVTSFFKDLVYLFELKLAHCKISKIPNAIFWNLKNLHKLDLSFNKLVNISKQSFDGLAKLKEIKLHGNTLLSMIEVSSFRLFKDMTILDLSGLSLSIVAANTFQGLASLEILNISYNRIGTVEDNAFKRLQNLKILDMQHNEVSVFGKDSFADLNSLSYLYTDYFMFCCIRPTSLDIVNCFPSQDDFSSCSDLLRNEVLRYCIWSVAVFAFFGNILSFVFRFLSERDTFKCGYGILVTNLSLADMLMGVYLLILSIADVTYRGRYVWNDVDWRNSAFCSFAGGLAIVSTECSVFILALITFDRFKSIKFLAGFTTSQVLVMCSVVWLTSIIIAVIPVLPFDLLKLYFGESFYSVSSVCLTLPLTTERLFGWGYSAGVLIVFNFVCFVFIAIGQSYIFVTVSTNKIMLEGPDRRIEFQVARSLSTIVIVNFLAWFPVCVIGANALYGGTITGDVYTWIAVFVMPLKSALNPILYTCSTISNSQLGQRILKRLGFQTTRFSTGKQVSDYLQNVHQIYKMRCLVLHQEKKYMSLKEYLTSALNIPMMNVIIVTARMAFILDKLHGMGITVGQFGTDQILVKPGTKKTISKLVVKCLPREVKDENDKRTNMGDFGNVLGWVLKRYNVKKVTGDQFRC